jgi:hypothetical protein
VIASTNARVSLAAAFTVTVAAAASAALLIAPGAAATAPTPVSCAELETEMNRATSGEVLELTEPGQCETNVKVTDAAPFTLQANPGTVLLPKNSDEPIIGATEEGVSFALEHLVFAGGKYDHGGCLSISAGEEAVTVREDAFIECGSAGQGGAVDIYDSGEPGSEPTVIEYDTFGESGEGNRAVEGGGAVQLNLAGPVRVTHNYFEDNIATGGFGGGGGLELIASHPEGAAPVTVSDNTFHDNSALDSGGGAFIDAAKDQAVTLERNVFSENKVAGRGAELEREGGGLVVAVELYGNSGGAPQVIQAHNTFSGNAVEATEATEPCCGRTEKLAAGGGGEWALGVNVKSTGDVFEDNGVTADEGQPPEGGGLGVLGTSAEEPTADLATFTAIDDLFLHNYVAAGGWGGGIYTGYVRSGCKPTAHCEPTTLNLEDSTVYENEVESGLGSQGGALWGSPDDSLTVTNSIIYANEPKEPEIWGYTTPTFKYSDVCTEPDGPEIPTGEGNICADPRLGREGTEIAASPTIAAGSAALVPAGLTTDRLGNPRIFYGPATCSGPGPGIVDMGAYEFGSQGAVTQPPQLSCATTTTTSTVTTAATTTTTATAPQLTGLRQSASQWRDGTAAATISAKRKAKQPPIGTTFSFSLSEPASVTLTFTEPVAGRKAGKQCVAQTKKNAKAHSCSRTVTVGSLKLSGRDGADEVHFDGVLSKRSKLKPGRYTVTAVATNSAGERSASEHLSFTIVK